MRGRDRGRKGWDGDENPERSLGKDDPREGEHTRGILTDETA